MAGQPRPGSRERAGLVEERIASASELPAGRCSSAVAALASACELVACRVRRIRAYAARSHSSQAIEAAATVVVAIGRRSGYSPAEARVDTKAAVAGD